MIILGIHDGHNASAALLKDGLPLAMMSEERLTYRKNDMGFPVKAVEACLQIAGIKAEEIDMVAFSTIALPLHYMRIKREFAFTIRDWLNEQEVYWKPKLFEGRENLDYISTFTEPRFNEPQAYSFEGVPQVLTPQENNAHLDRIRKETLQRLLKISPDKVKAFDHHTCHAHYAYFASPFRGKPALVFTADGGGDGTNGTLSLVENDTLKELARNNCSDVARIYRYITLMLGMKIAEHEFKVMGLAPYASDYEIKKCDKAFKDVFHVPDLLIEYKNKPRDLYFHFKEVLADCRFDGIAGAVQKMTEEVGAEWFSKVTKKLGVSRVVFSGGLSMNVKLNKIICELDSVDEFYCPASGGDESLGLGACYVAHKKYSPTQGAIRHIRNNYLGNDQPREKLLAAAHKIKGAKVKERATPEEVAKLLSQDVIIGRFVGRMEFGARSLGNRSIIANPTNGNTVRKINRQIKFRDFWMPFAPSVLDTHSERYLVNPKNILGDHMTHTYDVTTEGRSALLAALHPADFTVRAHIVCQENNPGYHELLSSFAKVSGVGAVLNTSFNLHGYPVVSTPEQALHVFENSNLDAMLLEDVLVLR